MPTVADEARYGIEELASLGGVTRRTVRYYVQEGLIPAPLGVGRGDHYGPAHLARLQAVKAFQEQGLSLDEVRDRLAGESGRKRRAPAEHSSSPVRPSVWRRIEVVPGVELHLGPERRLPAPERLRELAAWCERNFGRSEE